MALGVLAVGRHTQAPAFTLADTRLLRVLGEKLVLELDRVRLSEQAHQVHELGQRYEALVRRDVERERILDELGEGLLVVDPTGRILRMNAAGRELLGWPGLVSPSGDLGRLQDYEALQMRDAHDAPLLIDEWPVFRALRGQEFQQMEVRYFGPQGVERFLSFSGWPLRDEQGKVRQALLTFHEASSEQRALAQLEQMVRLADQRAHYVGSVLEAMTDCVLVCNNAGVLLLVNAAGKRLLGMEQQRLFPERSHVIGVYALGKCQRLIVLLREAGWDAPLYVHGALIGICEMYESLGVPLGPLVPVAGIAREALRGQIVLAPPSALADRWSRRLPDPVAAMASGWMRVKQRAKARGVELPLVISDHADWDELTETITGLGAGEIWVTHGNEDALVHYAGTQGLNARPLDLVGYDDEE